MSVGSAGVSGAAARRGAGAVSTPRTAVERSAGETVVPFALGTTTGAPLDRSKRALRAGVPTAASAGATAECRAAPSSRGSSTPSSSATTVSALAMAAGGTTSSLPPASSTTGAATAGRATSRTASLDVLLGRDDLVDLDGQLDLVLAQPLLADRLDRAVDVELAPLDRRHGDGRGLLVEADAALGGLPRDGGRERLEGRAQRRLVDVDDRVDVAAVAEARAQLVEQPARHRLVGGRLGVDAQPGGRRVEPQRLAAGHDGDGLGGRTAQHLGDALLRLVAAQPAEVLAGDADAVGHVVTGEGGAHPEAADADDHGGGADEQGAAGDGHGAQDRKAP